MAASFLTRVSVVVLVVCFGLMSGCGSGSHGDDDDGGSGGEAGGDGTTGGASPFAGRGGRAASSGGSSGDAGEGSGGITVPGDGARGGSAGSQVGGGAAEAGQGDGATSNGAQAGEGATSSGGSSNGGSSSGGSSNGGSSNGGDTGAGGDSNPPLPVECGDNILAPSEACEDGNLEDDDGCSHDCQVEPGFVCDAVRCDEHGEHCKLVVPVTYRDFNGHAASGGHPDFAPGVNSYGAVLGVVEAMLDVDGKPVLTSAGDATHGYFHGQAAFAEWYRDGSPASAPITETLTLWDLGGTLANMWGPQGEYWVGEPTYTNVVYGGPSGSNCSACTPSSTGIGACYDPCTPWGDVSEACCADDVTPHYMGDPLFFPIDDADELLDEARGAGSVPPAFGFEEWPTEQEVAQALGVSSPIPTATTTFPSSTHNFNFTTEASLWFRFDGSIITFRILADDDAWLFINGHLAVDLGGYHTPLEGAVSLGYEGDKIYMTQTPGDGATPVTRTVPLGDFGVSFGGVYELKLFHAEREPQGSTLSLVVSNGISHVSVCH